MPVINSENAQAWRDLAAELGATCPYVGRRVSIDKGKHKGLRGIVERHQRSKFGNAYRYASEASAHFRDMAGRYGWCCLVKTDAGAVWVNAEHVTCEVTS